MLQLVVDGLYEFGQTDNICVNRLDTNGHELLVDAIRTHGR